jgi:hypothetical protein
VSKVHVWQETVCACHLCLLELDYSLPTLCSQCQRVIVAAFAALPPVTRAYAVRPSPCLLIDLSNALYEQTFQRRYGLMNGSVLHLMDTELQEAVKRLMRRAFAPRFKHLIEDAEAKSLHGNEDGYVVSHVTVVESYLIGDLTSLLHTRRLQSVFIHALFI